MAAPVRVASAVKGPTSLRITLVGSVEPYATSKVACEVSGVVEAYPVRSGDRVAADQLLARLRTTELEILLRQARAERESVRANLAYAAKELDRNARLKEADSIANRKFDEVFYHHKSLQQQLARSEAAIDHLHYRIEQASVKAPFTGYVAREHTQIGEWIPVGGGVVTLLDLEQVYVTIDMPERYLARLAPAAPVSIAIPSIGADTVDGSVDVVLPQGNVQARTFPVRIVVANPQLRIKSGMEAKVTFRFAGSAQALLVPKDAVVAAGDKRLVYRVVEARAQPVEVVVEGYQQDQAVVAGQLDPGDQVVVRGNERLRPGQAVRILP
jgi:membrane fusion protein (multidrug efflux system)